MAAGECTAAVIGRAATICASQSRAYTARAEHRTFIDLLYSTRPQGSLVVPTIVVKGRLTAHQYALTWFE